MNKLETIQNKINRCIDAWESGFSKLNLFSWVDDALIRFDFYYAIHGGWVIAWNKSDRKESMNDFLREWNTIENISRALKETPEASGNNEPAIF